MTIVSEVAPRRSLQARLSRGPVGLVPVALLALDVVLISLAGTVAVLGLERLMFFGDSAMLRESVGVAGRRCCSGGSP